MRTCTTCQQAKPDSEFYDEFRRCCKECKKHVAWRGHIRRKFGLTPEDFWAMSESQGNTCAICDKPEGEGNRRTKLTIDHDHESGKIRGLLCHNCNTAIGLANDDSARLRRAADYLDHHNSKLL